MTQTEFIVHDGIAVKAKYIQTDTQHKKYDSRYPNRDNKVSAGIEGRFLSIFALKHMSFFEQIPSKFDGFSTINYQ